MVWNVCKGKGRVCVDPSSVLFDGDDGTANRNIPAPGTDGCKDECPAIHYASALHCHLMQIWNLHITHPHEDILQFVDDIQVAFHCMLYHPDAMPAFASVSLEFLILPVSTIFGACNSPSFFCLLSETRSYVASNSTYQPNDEPENLPALARHVRLVPDLTARE